MNPPWFAIFVVSTAALFTPLIISFFSHSLNPIGWLVLILTVLCAGCQSQKVSLNEDRFDDSIVRESTMDTARLRVSDGSLYQPAFRILDDRGRLRLIVQDPNTHHYVLVR
jgi:hypothetical protein